MESFLSGALMMTYLVAGLFFMRFWKESKDRLFALFSLAFFILACNLVFTALIAKVSEPRSYFYLVRLAAFLIILIAIINKNRSEQ